MIQLLVIQLILSTSLQASTTAPKQSARRILVMGDSHHMGEYGTALLNELSSFGHVLFLAVGGAGTLDYATDPIKNICCGYRIWEKTAAGQAAVLLERSQRRGEIVYKKFNGSLLAIVKDFAPTQVIVQLDINQTDGHQNFLNTLRKATSAPIAWIGVVKCYESWPINQRILKAIAATSNIFYVRNDDLKYLETGKCDFHTHGWIANRWARDNVKRVSAILGF